MIGTIIGDIAGSDFEFTNTLDYNFPMFAPGCDFTDDTVCTIAIADAILKGEDYQTALRKWCRRYPHPKGEYGSYFMNWVFRPDPYPYNSYGNGSAMRVSPIAWLFNNEAEVREQARKSAEITHNHPEGIKGAEAIAIAIYRMRAAVNKSGKIYEEVIREFYDADVIQNLPPKGFFDVTCQGCVPLSLVIASLSTSFEDAIRLAVSYGGDSDTVGAIVGALAEAQYEIPKRIKDKAISFLPADMVLVLDEFERRRHNM